MVPRDLGPQPIELPVTTIGKIPAALAKKLYSDLDAAWPISSLPAPTCPKSASFGTVRTIEFDYQKTPDLSCGARENSKLRALADDAQEIVKASGRQQSGPSTPPH